MYKSFSEWSNKLECYVNIKQKTLDSDKHSSFLRQSSKKMKPKWSTIVEHNHAIELRGENNLLPQEPVL